MAVVAFPAPSAGLLLAVVAAEGGFRVVQGLGRDTEGGGGAVVDAASSSGADATAGLAVLRAPAEPGREVLLRGEWGHIDSALGDESLSAGNAEIFGERINGQIYDYADSATFASPLWLSYMQDVVQYYPAEDFGTPDSRPSAAPTPTTPSNNGQDDNGGDGNESDESSAPDEESAPADGILPRARGRVLGPGGRRQRQRQREWQRQWQRAGFDARAA